MTQGQSMLNGAGEPAATHFVNENGEAECSRPNGGPDRVEAEVVKIVTTVDKHPETGAWSIKHETNSDGEGGSDAG